MVNYPDGLCFRYSLNFTKMSTCSLKMSNGIRRSCSMKKNRAKKTLMILSLRGFDSEGQVALKQLSFSHISALTSHDLLSFANIFFHANYEYTRIFP
jgi:hypothetical protein